MVLVVIIIGGVAVEVLHLAEQDGVGLACQQLGGVEPVGIGIHHLGLAWYELVASVDGDVDLRGHRLVALGLDEHYAVGTLGSVECGTVLEHLHALDVVDVEVGQDIVEVAVVQHLAPILHVHDDIVDDDEGLGIDVERVDAADEHRVAHAGNASAADAAHVGCQLLRDKRVDVHLGGIAEVAGLGREVGSSGGAVVLAEDIAIELSVGTSVADGCLLHVVAVDAHGDRAHVPGYVELIASVVAGHRGLAQVAVG